MTYSFVNPSSRGEPGGPTDQEMVRGTSHGLKMLSCSKMLYCRKRSTTEMAGEPRPPPPPPARRFGATGPKRCAAATADRGLARDCLELNAWLTSPACGER